MSGAREASDGAAGVGIALVSRRERSAQLAAPMQLAAYGLAFLNSVLIGRLFGATASTDAFFLALVVPNAVVAIVGAAFAQALQVVVARHRLAAPARLRARALALLSVAALPTLAVLQVVLPGAGLMVFLSGAHPDVARLAARWFPAVALGSTLQAVSLIVAASLHGSGRYAAASVHPVVAAALQLAALVGLGPREGPAILPWAFLASQVVSALVVVVLARRIDASSVEEPGSERPSARSVADLLLPLAWPMVVGAVAGGLSTVAQRLLAATLPPGELSTFSFAWALGGVPLMLFGFLLGAPTMTEIALAGRNGRGVDREVRWLLGLTAALLAPLGAGLTACAPDVIALLYGHRLGDRTGSAAAVLALLGVALLPLTPSLVLARAFFACGDARTPTKWGVAGILVGLAAMVPLVRIAGVRGLAGAYLVEVVLSATCLGWAGQRRWPGVAAGLRVVLLLVVVSGLGAFAGAAVGALIVHGPGVAALLARLALGFGGGFGALAAVALSTHEGRFALRRLAVGRLPIAPP